MIGRLHTVVLGLAALAAACGAPSSYDGLTGGSAVDASLAAPRPMSPLSVTMVATSRPRMKWELFDKETGAIVEVCKTRDFAPGTVKSFEGEGRELVVPEDLEPGIWFWRLKARAKGTTGTATSPTWEVLVRGPAARGASDVPAGAIVDVDGDGQPDLVTAGDAQPMPGDPFPLPVLLVFTGAPDATLATDEPQQRGITSMDSIREAGFVSVASGIDYDGDGFTDIAYAGLDATQYPDGTRRYDVVVELGGKFDQSSFSGIVFPNLPLYPGSIPNLAEGGDLNGDGFGDLLASDAANTIAAFGGRKGPMANVLLSSIPLYTMGLPSRPIHGAFDLNGDGKSDMVLGPIGDATNGAPVKQFAASQIPADSSSGDPMISARTAMFALGADALDLDQPKELSIAKVADVRSKAFASGDFDGDGLADIASTVPIDGTPRVCIWFGDRDKTLVPGPCASGLDGDVDLGASLTAGDIEGDGRDEILATVKHGGASEVRVLHVGDAGVDVAPIGQSGFGRHLTTVWPGRPGKARWAAVGDDGATIGVFEGGRLAQSVAKPRFIKENFGRALR